MCPEASQHGCHALSASEVSADSLRLLAILRRRERAEGDDGSGVGADALDGGLPSFESVLTSHHKKVYNLLYRLVGNAEDAADLTQETFVRAYGAYPRFRGASSAVYPWLCRIAVNAGKNKFKELSRRHSHEAFSLDGPMSDSDSCLHGEPGDDSADPMGLVQRQELEGKIQEAVQALSVEYRTVIVLRDMNGLSYKEVAEVAGLSVDIVKTRLFRARGILRRRLAGYLED